MNKVITLREEGKRMTIYDMGHTLQFTCGDAVFNVDKKKLMDILLEESRTYNEVVNERNARYAEKYPDQPTEKEPKTAEKSNKIKALKAC